MTTNGKFSLQWVNNTDFTRPMCTARFNLRDALSPHGEGGLTCSRLHLDQVHIHFRPNGTSTDPVIQDAEYRPGDDRSKDYLAETLQLYVRLSPGDRHVLYTSGRADTTLSDPSSVPHPQRSLVYSTALTASHNTGFDQGGDAYCRSYRPIRDLPALQHVAHLSELQVDLLWPLLQGDSTNTWWSVPDYRIYRVICEFSYAT